MPRENQEAPQRDQMSIERVAVPVTQEASVRRPLLSKIASIFKREAPGIARDIATGEAQKQLNPFSTESPRDPSPKKVTEPTKP